MPLSYQIVQRLLSFTLLISLTGILCFEMEGGIQLKRHFELHPKKTIHFAMLSKVLEENDEDSCDAPLQVLTRFSFNCNFSFLHIGEEQQALIMENPNALFPFLDLYILFRSFRI